MRTTLALLAVLLVGGTGCDSLAGCDEDVQRFEATYDDTFYDFYRDTILPRWEEQGYDCDSEPLRNAFGTRIGTRWTCTGCS